MNHDGKQLKIILINIGEFLFDRKRVAKNYLKGKFVFDLIACIPFSSGKYFKRNYKAEFNDGENFIRFNFSYTPRIYIICQSLQFIRLRKVKESIIRTCKRMKIQTEKTNLFITIWTVCILLHLIGCGWGAIAIFNT